MNILLESNHEYKSKIRELKLNNYLQESKVKKNAKIISVLFWFGSSLYIYSTDVGFSDVYSWKPFIFFILGPIFSAVVFGNIIYSLQKIIEKLLIKALAETKPNLNTTVNSCYILLCFNRHVLGYF